MHHRSLILTIVATAVILVSCALVGMGALDWWRLRGEGRSALAGLGRTVAERVAHSTAQAMWDNYDQIAGSVIEAEMAASDLRAIAIWEAGKEGKTPFQIRVRNADGAIASDGAMPTEASLMSAQAKMLRPGKTQPIGTVTVVVDPAAQEARERGLLAGLALRTVILDLLIVIGLALVLRRSLFRPLGHVIGTLEAMAAGDTSRRLPETGGAELVRLAIAVNRTIDSQQQVITAVAGRASTVADTAGGLDAIGQQLSGSAERSSACASNAGQAVAHVSTSAQSVATACEEMGTAIREIAASASQARGTADQADGLAQKAAGRMQELEAASREISSLVELISGIAEQTNLLALNASIEAAGAGEAGRGFAVVAGEVKSLARQTAEATAQAAPRIGAIQARIRAEAAEIRAIAEIIARISQAQAAVATAVERQTATTAEIGRSAAAAATAAQSIASAMTDVASATGTTAEQAARARAEAGRLRALSAELLAIAGRTNAAT